MWLLIGMLSLFLLASLYGNKVLYQRLSESEEFIEERDNTMVKKLDELKRSVDESKAIIEEVAGIDVVSNEPFVKRVVETIENAAVTFQTVRDELDNLLVEDEQTNEDEEDE